MKKLLDTIVEKNKIYTQYGKVADYIPALEKVDRDMLGACIVDLNGKETASGDCDVKFTIQSISKVIALIIALQDNGRDNVFKKVNVEPTGMGFNSIVSLEVKDQDRPYNPMINAGAIVTTSLIEGASVEERFERILNFIRKLANDDEISMNEEIYISEKATGDRNRALAYFMKGNGIIDGNVEEILDLYFRQCSVEITARDLAKMAVVLANDGVTPWNNERLMSREVCRIVKTIMVTCGMYDASGKFAVHVGLPAKSGVGGGIMATVPRKYGIGIFGPSLDQKGNSIAGIKIMKDISEELDLSIF